MPQTVFIGIVKINLFQVYYIVTWQSTYMREPVYVCVSYNDRYSTACGVTSCECMCACKESSVQGVCRVGAGWVHISYSMQSWTQVKLPKPFFTIELCFHHSPSKEAPIQTDCSCRGGWVVAMVTTCPNAPSMQDQTTQYCQMG